MAHHTAKLLKSWEVAEGTMAFRFEKPEGFDFEPGQFLKLRVPDLPQGEKPTRLFSIASAPEDPHLEVATRIRDSAFKQALRRAEPGLEVEVHGPSGDFILPEDPTKPVALLAGGIGVTPFRAMARHAARSDRPRFITLFSSNRTPQDAPFLDEFQKLAEENPRFDFVPTMTDTSTPGVEWVDERARIDEKVLARHLDDPRKTVFYVAGPPAMVEAMKGIVVDIGIPEDEVWTENFTGY